MDISGLYGSPTVNEAGGPESSPWKETDLYSLWSSLLNADTARVCSRYLKNDDCAIKILLRVIYQQFKDLLAKKNHLEDEKQARNEEHATVKKRLNFSRDDELRELQERNLLLETRLEEISNLLDNYNVLDARNLARGTLKVKENISKSPNYKHSPVKELQTPSKSPAMEILAPETLENINSPNNALIKTEPQLIEETVPPGFDLDQTIVPQYHKTRSPAKSIQAFTRSPVMKSKRKASSSETIKKESPFKKTRSDSLMFCSPSLIESGGLNYSVLQTTPEKKGFPNSPKPSTSNDSPGSSLPDTPSSSKAFGNKKSKQLKQITLLDPVFQGRIVPQSEKKDLENEESEQRKKTFMFDRPRPAEKKKKRKTPEDWPCAECRRLFYESKIDLRKLEVSMNFCPEHRNRFSYYLQTPPGFWDPAIPNGPRKAADYLPDDDDFE